MAANPLASEGRDIFRRILALPDEQKNAPAPPDLQDQFIRWRKRLLESREMRTHPIVDTAEAYVPHLTARLLAYNLELILKGL